MIRFKCSNADCGALLEIGDEFAGQRGECTGCGTPMVIPVPSSQASQTIISPPKPTPRPSPPAETKPAEDLKAKLQSAEKARQQAVDAVATHAQRIQKLEQQLVEANRGLQELSKMRAEKADGEAKLVATQNAQRGLEEKLKAAEQLRQQALQTASAPVHRTQELEQELAQLAPMRDALAKINGEKSVAESKLAEAQKSQQELSAKFQALDRSRQELAQTATAHAQRVQQLEQEVTRLAPLTESLAKAQREKAEAEAKLGNESHAKAAASAQSQKQIAQLGAEKTQLETQLAAAQREREEIGAQFQVAEQARQTAARTADAEARRIQQLEQGVAQLASVQDALAKANGERSAAESRLAEAQKIQQELLAQVQSLERSHQESAQAAAANAQRVQQLEQEVARLAPLPEALAKSQTERAQMAGDLLAAQKAHKLAEETAQSHAARVATLVATACERDNAVANFQAALTASQAEKQTADAEIARLQQGLEEARKSLAQAEKDNRMLQVTARDSARTFESLRKQIETLTVANAAAVRLQDELSQVRAEKSTVEAKLAVELQTKELMAAQFQAAEQARLQSADSTTASVQRVQKMEQEIIKLRKLLAERQRAFEATQPPAGETKEQAASKPAEGKTSPASEITIKYVSLNQETET